MNLNSSNYYNPLQYTQYNGPRIKRQTTTTTEYNDEGNVVKETTVEIEYVDGVPYYMTYNT